MEDLSLQTKTDFITVLKKKGLKVTKHRNSLLEVLEIENQCNIKPENFKENLNNLFIQGNDKILQNLNIIVDNLDVVLRKENIDI